MELKVGDFGLATKLEFEGEVKKTVCGTPNYIAPEVIDGKKGHSFGVDIWSLGVIIYTLLIGKPPFETSDVKTTYKKIKMNAYSFPEHIPISDAARDIITSILQLDPSKRPNLDQLSDSKFLNSGFPIPKALPTSTLACPPSASYLKQFGPSLLSAPSVSREKERLEATAPQQIGHKEETDIFTKTDRVKLKESNPSSAKRMIEPIDSKGPAVWVKKWVDYSAKYGLGYLLSNGCPGVFFNDSSKIILDSKGHHFDYIERRQADRQDVLSSFTLTKYPKELQKKVTLLQHFRSYLEGDAKDEQQKEDSGNQRKGNKVPIYLKKWIQTKHAIMFRLSNRVVQVSFKDKTEIILSSESKEVTYVNKKGERLTYPLTSAVEAVNEEMSKRLKYTKDILTHMLSTTEKKQEEQKNPVVTKEKGKLAQPTFKGNI